MSRRVNKLKAEGDVQGLIAVVSDQRCGKRERRSAVDALGELRAKEAVGALIPLLQIEGLMVHTANALGEIGDGRAAPHLVHLLKDRSRMVRMYGETNMRRLYAADPEGTRAAIEKAHNALMVSQYLGR
jgi:HEAT repeat protein